MARNLGPQATRFHVISSLPIQKRKPPGRPPVGPGVRNRNSDYGDVAGLPWMEAHSCTPVDSFMPAVRVAVSLPRSPWQFVRKRTLALSGSRPPTATNVAGGRVIWCRKWPADNTRQCGSVAAGAPRICTSTRSTQGRLSLCTKPIVPLQQDRNDALNTICRRLAVVAAFEG